MSRLTKDAHSSALGSEGTATIGGVHPTANPGFDAQFGDAVLQLKQSIIDHPDDERTQAIRTVEQIYDGRIVDMGRIIKEASLTRATPLSTIIIPRRALARQDAAAQYGKIRWMKINFDPALAGAFAVHGPHRIVSHRTVRYEAAFEEAAIGFTMSTKTLLKDEGVALAIAQGRQIVTDILDTYEFHVARAILNAHVDNIRKIMGSGLITAGTKMERSRREASNFAMMQKHPEDAFESALDRFRILFEMFNGTANVLLASDALVSHYASVDPAHAQVFNRKEPGDIALRPGFESYTRVRDKALLRMPTFAQDEQEFLDLISNVYRIGDCGIADARYGAHTEYNTKRDRSVLMWDEELHKWMPISPYRMVDESGMFDENGSMISLDNLPFAKDATHITLEQKKTWMMGYWDENKRALRPIQFFGQMGGMEKSNPHVRPDSQRVEDVMNFVDSVYPQVAKISMESVQKVKQSLSVIESFVTSIDQSTSNATTVSAWVQRFSGKNSDFSTGFIELPESAPNGPVFPPAFSSFGGLKALADAHILGSGSGVFNGAAVAEKYKFLPEALRIFNQMALFLFGSNGTSLVLDKRFAGPYLVNKTPADMLFEQMFTPHHVPLFVKNNPNAVRGTAAIIENANELSGDSVAMLKGKIDNSLLNLPSQSLDPTVGERIKFVNQLRSRSLLLGLLAIIDPLKVGNAASKLSGSFLSATGYKELTSSDTAALRKIAHDNSDLFKFASPSATKAAINNAFKTVNDRVDSLVNQISANPGGDVGKLVIVGGGSNTYTLTPLMIPIHKISSLSKGAVASSFVPASLYNFNSPMSGDEIQAAIEGAHQEPIFLAAVNPTGATVDSARSVVHYLHSMKSHSGGMQLEEMSGEIDYDDAGNSAMDQMFSGPEMGAHMGQDIDQIVSQRQVVSDDANFNDDVTFNFGSGRSLHDELSEPRIRHLYAEIHARNLSKADKAIATVFLLTPTHQRAWHAMMDSNLMFLPGFYIPRPAITVMASDIWMIQAGTSTGELLIKEYQNSRQTDVMQQFVAWRTTFELATVITGPENIARIPAAFIERYIRGMGTETLERTSMEETLGESSLGLTGDISFCPFRRGAAKNIGEFISLTDLVFEIYKHGFTTGQLRLSDPFDDLSLHIGPMESITGVMGEASTRHYNPRSGEYDLYRLQTGHLPSSAIDDSLQAAFSGNRSFGDNGMRSKSTVTFLD